MSYIILLVGLLACVCCIRALYINYCTLNQRIAILNYLWNDYLNHYSSNDDYHNVYSAGMKEYAKVTYDEHYNHLFWEKDIKELYPEKFHHLLGK